jgi:hypothetical protein
VNVPPNVVVKVAVTARATDIVTVQAVVPAQAPLHPEKVAPAAAVAVSVTTVPGENTAGHVALGPQLIPAGWLTTVPGPCAVTVRTKPWNVNVAVTVVAAFRVTTHEPVPEQPPPLQPAKTLPAAGVAVSVTTAPAPKVAEHTLPQLMPAGPDTVPVPAPARLTVSRNAWLVSTTRWTVPLLPEP